MTEHEMSILFTFNDRILLYHARVKKLFAREFQNEPGSQDPIKSTAVLIYYLPFLSLSQTKVEY